MHARIRPHFETRPTSIRPFRRAFRTDGAPTLEARGTPPSVLPPLRAAADTLPPLLPPNRAAEDTPPAGPFRFLPPRRAAPDTLPGGSVLPPSPAARVRPPCRSSPDKFSSGGASPNRSSSGGACGTAMAGWVGLVQSLIRTHQAVFGSSEVTNANYCSSNNTSKLY